MMSDATQAIVLAAGASSRFCSYHTKLAYPLCGQPLIHYPARALKSLKVPTCYVIGHQRELVARLIREVDETATFAHQTSPRGTGDALMCTRSLWSADTLLIMNGDMPLVTTETLHAMLDHHRRCKAAATFGITHPHSRDAQAFGRVFQTTHGYRIVEARHLRDARDFDKPANAGIYLFERDFLERTLEGLCPNNESGETYITDLIEAATTPSAPASTYTLPFDEVRGVNTRQEFAHAEHVQYERIRTHWIERGVYLKDPKNTYIDTLCTLEPDVCLHPHTHIRGASYIGRESTIETGCLVKDTYIGSACLVYPYSLVYDSTLDSKAHVGPFAYVHGATQAASGTHVGSFVETKATTLDTNTKAKHLAYLGNATIGKNVTIGAGTIICNYDGATKHTTTIDDNCFIGSNTALVAPVNLEHSAIIGAGSTITECVPSDALAIARARQVNKEGYASHIRRRQAEQTTHSSHQKHEDKQDPKTVEGSVYG